MFIALKPSCWRDRCISKKPHRKSGIVMASTHDSRKTRKTDYGIHK